jgi:pimeloyl-ACP methyl ester carboxylesterase
VNPVERSLYPFEAHWFDRGDGIRMHYLDEGPASPAGTVVFLHGNPSWSFYWRELVKALASTHRCIAVDHVGMGPSDKPSETAYPYTLRARVEDLGKLLDAVVPDGPLSVVAHDWGGMIGMAWAVEHAARVRRLALLNTAAFPLPATKALPWQLALTRTPVGTVLVRGLNAFAWGATVFGMARREMPHSVQQAYLAPYDSWANRVATLRFVQDIPLTQGVEGYDLVTATADKLSRFRDTPVLLGFGAQDFVFDDHFLEEWKRRLPGARVIRLEDAGHYVLEDAPEVMVPAVASFLREG